MFRIGGAPIDPRELEAGLADPAYGGVVTFLGVVRDRADDGRRVDGLHYESYEPMALAEFAAIAAEAHERFGTERLAIAHRVGDLQVGEIAVAVVAAARHRGTAFDACRYAIDELKRRAPIWKKERYADGEQAWKANAC